MVVLVLVSRCNTICKTHNIVRCYIVNWNSRYLLEVAVFSIVQSCTKVSIPLSGYRVRVRGMARC